MNFITKMREFIIGLEPKYLRYGIIGFFVFLLLLVGIWFFVHQRIVASLHDHAVEINALREKSRKILTRHELVKKQKAEVDTMLNETRDFRLVEYFESLLLQLNLKQFNTKPGIRTEESLGNGYEEIRLDAGFTGLNTKQLVELLDKIDHNDRVFTKQLVVNKSLKSSTIDVVLVIATLQPQAVS